MRRRRTEGGNVRISTLHTIDLADALGENVAVPTGGITAVVCHHASQHLFFATSDFKVGAQPVHHIWPPGFPAMRSHSSSSSLSHCW